MVNRTLELNKIYCMDCVEGMKQIEDNSIHLCFTSPPYNCNIQYDTYNDNRELEEYFSFIKEVFAEVYRILVVGGRCAVNIPNAIKIGDDVVFLGVYYQRIFDDIGFITREHITWVKGYNENNFQGNNTAWGSWKSPSNPHLRSLTEKIIVLSKKNMKLEGVESDLTANEFKEWTKNCWFVPTDNSPEHPATFPFELAKRIIKLYSWKGNTIIEPFSGRGTTCIMAKTLNRDFIGFEISQRYVDIANKRLTQETLQSKEWF